MDEGGLPPHLPPRRRPSIFSRARNRSIMMSSESKRTAARPVGECVGRLPEEEERKDVFVVGLDTASNVDVTPQTPVRRKPRASFSGFSHAVSDLRTLPKRMSSQRKNPVVANDTFQNDLNYIHPTMQSADINYIDEPSIWDQGSRRPPHPKAPGWLRRCVSTTFRHRRRTFDTPSRPATAKWPQNDTFFVPAPAIGTSPPTVPENCTSGSAARAAAAAQNEMLDYLRKHKRDQKNRKVRGDGESGVGIDIRPAEMESTMARRGSVVPPLL